MTTDKLRNTSGMLVNLNWSVWTVGQAHALMKYWPLNSQTLRQILVKRFSATLDYFKLLLSLFPFTPASEYSRFSSLLFAREVSLQRNVPSGEERGDTAIFAPWLLALLSLLFSSFYFSMKLGWLEFSVFPYFLASTGFELKDLFPPRPPTSLASKLDVTVETDDVICGWRYRLKSCSVSSLLNLRVFTASQN